MTFPMVVPSVKYYAVQESTGQKMQVAWADQVYTGEDAKTEGQASGIEFRGVKLSGVRKGFVLLLFHANKVRESELKSKTMRGWYRPEAVGQESMLDDWLRLVAAAQPAVVKRLLRSRADSEEHHRALL